MQQGKIEVLILADFNNCQPLQLYKNKFENNLKNPGSCSHSCKKKECTNEKHSDERCLVVSREGSA